MNGRVYDPVLGRFLSADPYVDSVVDSQSLNRYSYVSNNPLGYTDPSGYFKLKDVLKIAAVAVAAWATAGIALKLISPMLGMAGTSYASIGAAMGAMTSGSLGLSGAVVAGAGAGFGSGFAGSLLNGGSIGDAFRSGAIGAVVGGVSAGLAFGIGELGLSGITNHLAHGVAQGAITEAMGGEFRHGFYAAAFASAAAGPISRFAPGGVPGQVLAAAVVGGTASAIGGGKFSNGAMSGAFTYLFNHAAHRKGDYDAYYLVDEDSVAGVGHVAILLVNESGGVTYASFSPGDVFSFNVGDNIDVRHFKNLADARSELSKIRLQIGKKNEYDRYLKYSLTKAQYNAGISEIFTQMQERPTYWLKGYNCDNFNQRILSAAGINLRGNFTPNWTLVNNSQKNYYRQRAFGYLEKIGGEAW